MYHVSEIQKISGGKYMVTLDEEIQFPLYGKELGQFGIEEDACLEEHQYRTIMTEVLPKRAKMRAMHLLQSMDRTEHQLRQKLSEGGYPQEVVDAAVDYVKGYHYIDDLRYATNYISSRSESRSMRQIEQELYRKGISRELFAAACDQCDQPDEEEQIRQWAEKKGFHADQADRKETERFYNFLLRRGYHLSTIRSVFREIY